MLGAHYLGQNRCRFTFWHPCLEWVNVIVNEQRVSMTKTYWGYWQAEVDAVRPGDFYTYEMDLGQGREQRSDPASMSQPQGIHGSSAVVDHTSFIWTDHSWQPIPLAEMVIYELHVGTFTPEGTFAAIIPRLPRLQELGINTIELMPVSSFPGNRNWGYDGVFPFAVQHSYGGVEGLKHFVNACHHVGISVLLDVVYNHLGPEGNYLWDLGLYFTDQYCTPWGSAVNFDGPYSDGVRHYFIENALYWLREFHIDGLRLDAVHAIYDLSSHHILLELQEKIKAFAPNRPYYLIAESDLNDTRLLRPSSEGGYAIDAQWSDDFHHSLHSVLTEEKQGYYGDFGELSQIVTALKEGFVYQGQYSDYRKRRHGSSSAALSPDRFVVYLQNHDQVGNRILGDRLCHLVSFDRLKLGVALLLLSPYIPLLFMGEEYGETNPFLYFVHHSDPGLIANVRRSRAKELARFYAGEPPDPQAEATFNRSILQWDLQNQPPHSYLWRFYQKLLTLRRTFMSSSQDRDRIKLEGKILYLYRSSLEAIFNFGDSPYDPLSSGQCILHSNSHEWGGGESVIPKAISPYSVHIFTTQSIKI
jgi:maltooligosyltrehalose trehalohydrolase